jgi:predicted nucleotidyltransferase
MDGSRVSRDEIGYIPYAEVVVRTIRKDNRGFVRAR